MALQRTGMIHLGGPQSEVDAAFGLCLDLDKRRKSNPSLWRTSDISLAEERGMGERTSKDPRVSPFNSAW